MQVVIDIPEEVLNSIKTFKGKFLCENGYDLIQGIKDGTPLPKGHGRLIDADETFKKHCVDFCREKPSCYEDCLIYDLFYLAPTIIEADRAERSEE